MCLYVTVWLTKGIYKGIFKMKASHDILSQDVLGKEINSNRPPRDKCNPKFPVIIKREAKGKQKRATCSYHTVKQVFFAPDPILRLKYSVNFIKVKRNGRKDKILVCFQGHG